MLPSHVIHRMKVKHPSNVPKTKTHSCWNAEKKTLVADIIFCFKLTPPLSVFLLWLRLPPAFCPLHSISLNTTRGRQLPSPRPPATLAAAMTSTTDFDNVEITQQYSHVNTRFDLSDEELDNDNSSARLFERSRIKALAGERMHSKQAVSSLRRSCDRFLR